VSHSLDESHQRRMRGRGGDEEVVDVVGGLGRGQTATPMHDGVFVEGEGGVQRLELVLSGRKAIGHNTTQ
jgi:hypothetical protein